MTGGESTGLNRFGNDQRGLPDEDGLVYNQASEPLTGIGDAQLREADGNSAHVGKTPRAGIRAGRL